MKITFTLIHVWNFPVAGSAIFRTSYNNTPAKTQVREKRFSIKFAHDVYSGYVDNYVLISIRSHPLIVLESVPGHHMISPFIQRLNLIFKCFCLFYFIAFIFVPNLFLRVL